MTQPIQYVWSEGEGVMRPLNPSQRREAGRRYGDGEIVPLDVANPRSKASHDHFFTVVREAWETLPEHLTARFPTDESLRHYALCEGGFCDVINHACASHAEALRWLPRVQAMAKPGSQIAVVGPAIVVREPQSQSMKAMGGKVFQESKARCLEIIADLLETPVAALGMARAA